MPVFAARDACLWFFFCWLSDWYWVRFKVLQSEFMHLHFKESSTFKINICIRGGALFDIFSIVSFLRFAEYLITSFVNIILEFSVGNSNYAAKSSNNFDVIFFLSNIIANTSWHNNSTLRQTYIKVKFCSRLKKILIYIVTNLVNYAN